MPQTSALSERCAFSVRARDKEPEENALIKQLPVRRIMQHEVLTVEPDDSLVEATPRVAADTSRR